MIKTIGVLTSGGDSPGMNAAIRAVVRTALHNNLKVKGIREGFAGLLNENIFDMTATDVSDIISRGGTVLYSARCEEFRQAEYQKKGAEILKKHNIDALVVIGGDGSFNGALRISENGINVVAIPGTIDLDIACTDYTIGFDTSINTAMEAIDKIRDTSSSHARCSVVEVMGRRAGYIALWTGIATGAEDILLPEKENLTTEELIAKIDKMKETGRRHYIIINAEGIGNSDELASMIQEKTGIATRATILGHIQRGGSPSCKDRYYASIMGAKAVDTLLEGKNNRVIVYKDDKFIDLDIVEALSMTKTISDELVNIADKISSN